MCSVGDRLDRMQAVYNTLAGQAAACLPRVEVLVFTDNRCRSIGFKRQALLNIARGDYVCFVDDDDDVSDQFVQAILTALDMSAGRPDVVAFPTRCVSPIHGDMRVEHSISFDNEEAVMPGFRRKPWFMHPIRRGLAIRSEFPDTSWAEDSAWLQPLWPLMNEEIRASSDALYVYHWNDDKPNPDKPNE